VVHLGRKFLPEVQVQVLGQSSNDQVNKSPRGLSVFEYMGKYDLYHIVRQR
jgi:hypothetical protein